ncbi:hypothetical protein HY639_05505 [Candidatus Woesearchaeota archaeon]|nr:hypothetical protein [Candidatus Woesearchaeota archaeon]
MKKYIAAGLVAGIMALEGYAIYRLHVKNNALTHKVEVAEVARDGTFKDQETKQSEYFQELTQLKGMYQKEQQLRRQSEETLVSVRKKSLDDVSRLEKQVVELAKQVDAYKQQQDREREAQARRKLTVSNVDYVFAEKQFDHLSFVLHNMGAEEMRTLETTMDTCLRKLNKKREPRQEAVTLLYHDALTDPEDISIGEPWAKVFAWQDKDVYHARVVMSLQKNRDVRLVERLGLELPVEQDYLDMLTAFRNYLK